VIKWQGHTEAPGTSTWSSADRMPPPDRDHVHVRGDHVGRKPPQHAARRAEAERAAAVADGRRITRLRAFRISSRTLPSARSARWEKGRKQWVRMSPSHPAHHLGARRRRGVRCAISGGLSPRPVHAAHVRAGMIPVNRPRRICSRRDCGCQDHGPIDARVHAAASRAHQDHILAFTRWRRIGKIVRRRFDGSCSLDIAYGRGRGEQACR